MRYGGGDPVIGASHGLGSHNGINHGFFDSLHNSAKQGIHFPALHTLDFGIGYLKGRLRAIAFVGTVVGGGEGEEDVAGLVSFNGSNSSQSDGHAAGKALELIGSQRS